MSARKKNVFVLGLDDRNRERLEEFDLAEVGVQPAVA